jgi:hypothetical protein
MLLEQAKIMFSTLTVTIRVSGWGFALQRLTGSLFLVPSPAGLASS